MAFINGFSVIDQGMLDFVGKSIAESDSHATELRTRFTFRNRFHHCVRVALIAVEIAESEGADVEVAAVSGLFHDVGKAAGRNHAEASAEICRCYLEENRLLEGKTERIVDCVRHHHSASTTFDACAYPNDLAILRDADLLDETGAMGIAWTLLGMGTLDLKSYRDAFARLAAHHTPENAEEQLSRMRTATGRSLMRERVGREQRFIRELSAELRIERFEDMAGIPQYHD